MNIVVFQKGDSPCSKKRKHSSECVDWLVESVRNGIGRILLKLKRNRYTPDAKQLCTRNTIVCRCERIENETNGRTKIEKIVGNS